MVFAFWIIFGRRISKNIKNLSIYHLSYMFGSPSSFETPLINLALEIIIQSLHRVLDVGSNNEGCMVCVVFLFGLDFKIIWFLIFLLLSLHYTHCFC